MIKRPPIGIPPQHIVEVFRRHETDPFQLLTFDFNRFIAIKEAIQRYYKAEMNVPQEWAFEYASIQYSRLYCAKYFN